jgi:hypothetical protein
MTPATQTSAKGEREALEVWRSIEGFERLYEVSNQGRVRSLDHLVHQVNRWGPMVSLYRGRVLSSSVANNGYLQVTLSKGNIPHQKHVHTLVARAFLGRQPEGCFVCHNDGNKLNCRDGNLYYGTPKQNADDAGRHGTRACGERQGAAKLTDAAVAEIRARAPHEPYRVLAEKFGVTRTAIGMVARAKSWRHLLSEGADT